MAEEGDEGILLRPMTEDPERTVLSSNGPGNCNRYHYVTSSAYYVLMLLG